MLLAQTAPPRASGALGAVWLRGTVRKRAICPDVLRCFIECFAEGSVREVKAEPEMRCRIAAKRRRLLATVGPAEGDICRNF